ncbi:MAG: hypothetical protein IJW25_02320 [Clostridia bacterium]|nr:hypothetical protein [Clostridia bacterium]
MNKKRAKFSFVLTGILLAIALVLCFVQFQMPFSNTNFNGLFNSISATNDLKSGYTAVYEITSDNVTNEEVNNTISLMRTIISNNGIDNANVYRQGDYIRAEVQETSNSANILSIIGSPTTFFISGTDQESITEEELKDYDIVGTDVKNAFATSQVNMNKTYNGITIEFTKSGAEKYQELSKQVAATESSTIYFYIGGAKQTSLEIEESKEDSLSFYFDGNNISYENAQTFALQILMSSTGVNLEIISNNQTSPTLGNQTLMLCLIALVAALVAVLVLFPVFYGRFGIIADLSVLFGVVFNIFALQALPFTTSSIAGLIGSAFGMAVLVVCHVIYLNKMKSEFKALKKLQLSAKTGFKKSWLKNLDICALTFLSGVSLGLFNIPFVSTFGISLAIGSFIALFNTIVMFKDFVTWYVYINPKNFKAVKFTKEEGNE